MQQTASKAEFGFETNFTVGSSDGDIMAVKV
jgi:hypothetical protein